jgi:hypothetical protein
MSDYTEEAVGLCCDPSCDAYGAICGSCTRIAEALRAAHTTGWRAGAEAMKEAAAKECDDSATFFEEQDGYSCPEARAARDCARYVLALPLPPCPPGTGEVKP